ncbi:MAG: hypothetical protein JXB15_09645 [Anaerolineales bacterium]|nr:hypothetical protein [Anaerolineales bacterium]
MTGIHLWPEKVSHQDGKINTGFYLEEASGSREHVWYQIPAEQAAALTSSADPFVLGALFSAMRAGKDLIVHGEVSPSLLRNLDEFQQVWSVCKPHCYTHIDVIPDQEREQPRHPDEAAITAFSGGVDSCFTAWRHRTGQAGRGQRNLQAALMVHGFDISLRLKEEFQRSSVRAKKAAGQPEYFVHSHGKQSLKTWC